VNGVEKVPGKCGGRAVIVHTRLTVANIEAVRRSAREWGLIPEKSVRHRFPYLSQTEIQAAFDYADEHPEEMLSADALDAPDRTARLEEALRAMLAHHADTCESALHCEESEFAQRVLDEAT
jgi:uncharacterized protein (DUF433 family)